MDGDGQANIGDLQAEIGQLRSDLSKIADTLKTIMSGEAKERYAQVRGAAEGVQQRATQTAEVVGQEISERPFTSVATAFGAGILLGLLFGRRS